MARRSKLAAAAIAATIIASLGVSSVAAAPDAAPKMAKRDTSYCC